MMKRMTAILLLVMATTLCAIAQRPFEGHFFCKETGVNLYLNLYEETLEAPGFSFLGKMNGYMNQRLSMRAPIAVTVRSITSSSDTPSSCIDCNSSRERIVNLSNRTYLSSSIRRNDVI